MNDTSMVTMSTGPGRSDGCRLRAFRPSMTSTRGSLRRRQSICPCPTSSAMTRRAPRCRSTSVKPPVDAPMSRQSRACTAIAKASSACASFSPPRPTYGWSGTRSESAMSGGTNVPGLSGVPDPACTCPAMISARARSRDGASPRSTSRVSRRTFFIEERGDHVMHNAQCTRNFLHPCISAVAVSSS
jgi:hypothetical protein